MTRKLNSPEFIKNLQKWFIDFKKHNKERDILDKEIREKMMEEHLRNHAEINRLKNEFHKKYNSFHREQNELQWYHRNNKLSQILIVIFNIIVWFIIFRYFGAKTVAVIIASLISIGGTIQFIFNMRLEKRIFKPINQLKVGVNEISKGNYAIELKCDVFNEIGLLINSFNDMARKLLESENLKKIYEENRKTLIANISHDLKTPITSIQGYIETMLERSDVSQETISKYHQIIYNNAAYMNKLIDDLFLFSKLDLQKLEPQLESISVKAFMEDLMGEFKYELEDRDIKFIYEDTMIQDCNLSIDRKRINQVFRNIIGNAIKYSYEKNTEISVKLYTQETFVCIDITDNGPGIPEDKLPYIFDRFFRIDSARTTDLMSTGLGLAIAKELVEAHEGKLSVASEENVGTTFTVILPAEKK
ncbi:MAG: sensor histidine kinase [Ruminiclostridium sp.]